MPFLLRIPPNSRTNFRGYVNKFIGQPMDLEDVMTRITFEQGGIGTLKFEAIGWLDETTVLPLRNKLIAAKATDALVGRTDLPRQEALPPPPANPYPVTDTITIQPGQAPATATVHAAPFVPAQPAAQPQSAPLAAQPSAVQPATQPSPSEQPTQRRRRRTQAEMQAAQTQQPAQAPTTPSPPQQAPFMPPSAAAPAQPSPSTNGQAQPTGFGMAPGAPANPELSRTLEGLFGPK